MFQKDILCVIYLCEQLGLDSRVAEYWNLIICLNDLRISSFVADIVKTVLGTANGESIAVFGFAFKNDTSGTKESPAILVCRQLIEEGAKLKIFDQKVRPNQIRVDLGATGIRSKSFA